MRLNLYKLITGILLLVAALVTLLSCSLPLGDLQSPKGVLSSTPGPSESALAWFQGQVLVGYDSDAALTQIANTINGRVVNTIPEIGAARIDLPANLSVTEAVTLLMQSRPDGLRYAEPNYIRKLIQPENVDGLEPNLADAQGVSGEQSGRYDDPLQVRQWGLSKIHAEEAWQQATGRGVIIGIVDTGIDGTHPDLIGKQLQGRSCLDDKPIEPDSDGSQSENAHASHVAGIATANGDNHFGIVGVAPDARFMSLRIFDKRMEEPDNPEGYVGDDKVAACIIWAATIGPDGIKNSGDEARVLNNSWGGRGYSQTLKEGIDKVISSGVTFVNSMGNSGSDETLNPTATPGVLGVGATSAHDKKSDFSTMGPTISIGAPGEDILSSVPQWLLKPDGSPYDFQYFDGTSMAAPQVTGAIALLLQKFPKATPYQLKKVIEGTADDIETPGFDRLTGFGRLNLAKALGIMSLPEDGATVIVHVLTHNAGDTNHDGRVDQSDKPIGVPYTDVILRNSHGDDRYFVQTNAEGNAEFYSIDPGPYQVLVGAGDVMTQLFRPANRLTQRTQITAISGQTAEASVEFNTTLSVSISWSEPVTVELQVSEPRSKKEYAWVTASAGNAKWGTFSSSSQSDTYILSDKHFPNAVYKLALSGKKIASSAKVSVTITENGISETYGPFTVQPGQVLASTEWEGWWENFPDKDLGFTEKGPGGPWVY
ncbi:S8 family serine peptidase [Candidatus Acetothermia bacterium]|nr:S8 family serine peptidase [Candidatus Acetothermia bacterium]MBI3643193.1 S8 family serine peptidase [Candidatus Acetothermia bacterium]